jgi:glutaconate CoA-transferase subunit A
MLLTALEAGAKRLPHLPTKSGLGTDVLSTPTTPFKVYSCPISGEPLVAVPALIPDIAFLHVNYADRTGNAVIAGDTFADLLMARAARRVYLTAEKIVDDIREIPWASGQTRLSRLWVTGVSEAPHGAAFTTMWPDYPGDIAAASEYQSNCVDRAWLSAFCTEE